MGLDKEERYARVQRYWRTVGKSLAVEMDLLEIVDHDTERGSAAESILRDLLRQHLPGRYRVTSGAVAYADGSFSDQCDLLIVDELLSTKIYSRDGFELVAPRSVLARIEISRTAGATQGMKKVTTDFERLTAFSEQMLKKTPKQKKHVVSWVFTDIPRLGKARDQVHQEVVNHLSEKRAGGLGPVGICVPRAITAFVVEGLEPMEKLHRLRPSAHQADALVSTRADDCAWKYSVAVFLEALLRGMQHLQYVQCIKKGEHIHDEDAEQEDDAGDGVAESAYRIPTLLGPLARNKGQPILIHRPIKPAGS